MKKDWKSIMLTAMVCVLAGGMAMGSTVAYMTDNETATNTVTVGDVTVSLEEPSYPGNGKPETENLMPHEEVPKDPQVENIGTNDTIVFMLVESPVGNVTLVNEDGTKGTQGVTDLFWFKDVNDAASVHRNIWDETGWDNGWIMLDATDVSTVEGEPSIYVFGYSETIAPTGKTSTLFDKIQLKSFIEGEVEAGAAQKIKVCTYAIQPAEILGEDGSDLTDDLNKENLESIYSIYLNQFATD